MSESWDFYPCQVEGEPASIFLDLGIAQIAPVKTLQHMAWFRLYMNHPREDGLSSQEEYQSLVAVEVAFEAVLKGRDDVVYVGRNTCSGTRDFFAYIESPSAWEKMVSNVMASFTAYEFETGTREDASWETYFDFLYPSEEDRQRMENRKVLQALEDRGDSLTVAREIHHWANFETQSAADSYVAATKGESFSVVGVSAPKSSDGRYSVQVVRSDTPSHECIHEVTLLLFHMAREHGGDYDGWETSVETS